MGFFFNFPSSISSINKEEKSNIEISSVTESNFKDESKSSLIPYSHLQSEMLSTTSLLFRGEANLSSIFHDNCVVIAQIPSATKQVAALADRLGLDFAIVTTPINDENIIASSNCKSENLIGNVSSKLAWIFSDIIDDPSSFIWTSKIIKAAGALIVGIVAIHPLLSEENLKIIEASPEIDIVY